MFPRITFLLIGVFWAGMNVLLWRAEYDSHGAGIPVPPVLVWQKILTAPDISSLNVFQDGQRTGFCEFSTSVEQEMATLGENDAMPKNISSGAGYQIRFNGNVSLGDYTNRLTFNGQLEFSRRHQWRELNLKLSSHAGTIEIHSLAKEQNVHLIFTSDGMVNEQVFTFAELQNPNLLWHSLAGNFGDWTDSLDFPIVSETPITLATDIQWQAHRDRLTLSGESVPVYRLETRVLDHPIRIYVSTLGEILRVELPSGTIASFDQLGTP